jgi:hypothetical protein
LLFANSGKQVPNTDLQIKIIGLLPASIGQLFQLPAKLYLLPVLLQHIPKHVSYPLALFIAPLFE